MANVEGVPDFEGKSTLGNSQMIETTQDRGQTETHPEILPGINPTKDRSFHSGKTT